MYIYKYIVTWFFFCPFLFLFLHMTHLKDSDQTNFNIAQKYKMQFLNDLRGEETVQTNLCKGWEKKTWKMKFPLLLNRERTVINHIILESYVRFHLPNPGLITARPVESRNHLNKTCLTKWSMLKEQHIMLQSKEIQEQMRKTKWLANQSGKSYKAISKVLGLQWTTVRAIINKWRKLRTVVNLPRSGWPTIITPRAQWRLIQEVIK